MTTETLVRFLWPMIWQSALLAVAVGGVTLLLRERLEPRWRYLLWVVVLVRLALPVLPGSPVGILPAQHPEKTTAVVAVSSPGTAMPPATAFQTPAPSGTEVVQETRAQEIGTRSVSECQETAARSVSDGLLGRLIVFRQFNPSLTFRAAVEMTTRTIFAVWLCGALFFAFKYVSGEIWLQRLCRRVRPPDDETLNTLLDECRREMRIRRRVRLYIVSQEIAAASFGVIFPKILVSERVMRQFSAEALRLVLLHELAHIKRLDSAVHVLTRLITIFHWPNPVLWLTRRRLECEREHACDAAVLHKLERKKHREYGQMVLTFADWYAANHAAKRHASALVGVFPNHDLKRRITMIIKHKPPRWWQTLLGATLLATLTLAGLTTAKPATANPTSGNMSNENTTNRAATEKTENQEKNLLTLHGSVVDENNNPVTGIRIWPAINRWLGDDTPHEPVFTDQNGKFIVSVDEKNAWKWGTIYAISDDKTLSGNYSVSPQEGTRTRWGSDIVITVKKTGLRTISGTVVVADGKPAEGVLVRNTSLIPGDAYATKT
ncbi:MAG: M56 family metallopeptidase, partial [Planctomycetaceae bacterium]|nr:M56 family metallopeptidase [Planctomycetaceae bacterium]